METQAPKREFAWQPFTPRGVSLFVSTSFARLFSIQFVFSLFAASVMVWFLNHSWFPTITAAIKQLPAEGEIRNGKLAWPADSPARLAESHFLAFSVDLQHEGQARSPSHLLVEFGGSDLKIFSLLGYVQSIYPKTWRIAFNQPELEPAWGAWAPPLLGLAACAVVAGLMLCWAILATLYFCPIWLLGFLSNRDLSMAGSWRLAGASLMPGALFFTASIWLYGIGGLDLIQLAVATGLHLLLGWAYLVLGLYKLPSSQPSASIKENPFAATEPESNKSESSAKP